MYYVVPGVRKRKEKYIPSAFSWSQLKRKREILCDIFLAIITVRSQTTELNQSLPQAQILGFRSKFHG
jgi:hypothetical protein